MTRPQIIMIYGKSSNLKTILEWRTPNASFFKRFLLSPLATLLLLSMIDFARRFEWYTASMALSLGLLALCIFWSGLRANLVSAVFISTYTFLNYDFSFAVQVAISAFLIAIPCGLLHRWAIELAIEAERNRHAANLINAANGNLAGLVATHERVGDIVQGWSALSDQARYEFMLQLRGDLANLLTIWEGWHQLYKEREIVKWNNLKKKLDEEHKSDN